MLPPVDLCVSSLILLQKKRSHQHVYGFFFPSTHFVEMNQVFAVKTARLASRPVHGLYLYTNDTYIRGKKGIKMFIN